jgi:hypothetical protein
MYGLITVQLKALYRMAVSPGIALLMRANLQVSLHGAMAEAASPQGDRRASRADSVQSHTSTVFGDAKDAADDDDPYPARQDSLSPAAAGGLSASQSAEALNVDATASPAAHDAQDATTA